MYDVNSQQTLILTEKRNRPMSNKLVNEKSPYLLEHADNPVQWYPWGEEALTLAKKTGKPILLSLGYSACHWCHAMAYESFEDQETADLMNKLFINIKVDREERPDLDKIYQLAHQLITQRSGGWPLTVFLTPDEHIPFYAGTYFPKESDKHNPSFMQILNHIAHAFNEKKEDIETLSTQLKEAFAQLTQTKIQNVTLHDEPIYNGVKQLLEDFDEESGGFGDTPKFPHPLQCQFLLSVYARDQDQVVQKMILKTLDSMALGGIYDQLGGGFFRYSTDSDWEIPHFEKMLYDTALLISTYCQAYQTFKQPLYLRIIEESCNWLLNTMQSQAGAFYASLNADSAGMEGGYYLWDKAQIHQLLDDKAYVAIKNYFNLDEAANFENLWHLYVKHEPSFSKTIAQAKKTLLAERKKHLPPSRDKKILSGWNALAIKALYQSADLLQRDDYRQQADKALAFICENMFIRGKLQAIHKDEQSYLFAYLDDVAYLLDAILQKLQHRNDKKYQKIAKQLVTLLTKHFYDKQHGALFFTADYHEKIIHRPKILLDDATPAGNSIAAMALLSYGKLFKDDKAVKLAKQTLSACWEYLSTYPAAHCSLLQLLLNFV